MFLKRQGRSTRDLAAHNRLLNYIKKLGDDEHQIESLIANLLGVANSLQPEQIVELANELFEIAKSESIPLFEVPAYVRQKTEEKQKLEVEIQKAGATLQSRNVDIQTIEEYKGN